MVERALSLYVHIPFCRRKCPYCHFFVLKDDETQKDQLLKALHQELTLYRPLIENSQILSLYLGGGTPSLFGIDRLESLLSALSLDSPIEITIEANPDDINEEKMRAFRNLGINRLSIGVQSLVDSELQTLGRLHSAQEAVEAIHISSQAGFDNISIDLMFETPDQTIDSWAHTLSYLPSLPIQHLSLYNLTFEAGAAFERQKKRLQPRCPTDEKAKKMLDMALDKCASIGLERYEISAFARPGFASKHNSGYWTARPFIGLGPSAFSYLEGKRFRNRAHFSGYLKDLDAGKIPIDFEENLPYPANLHELLAVELRLVAGVDLPLFERRHGELPPLTHEVLEHLQKKGFLTLSNPIALTEKGRLFYDEVAAEII